MEKIYFRPDVRSRHPSHKGLRRKGALPMFPFKSVVRFGSITDYPDTVTNGGTRLEINTIESVEKSSNKLWMKQAFMDNNITTAEWYIYNEMNEEFEKQSFDDFKSLSSDEMNFPIIAKNVYGSRGMGNYKIENAAALDEFVEKNIKKIENYIFEKFYNYSREYRLHVTQDGCFYTCRKMLKKETPKKDRWFRNDSNSVWILEENPDFDKPVNWDNVVEMCVNAVKAVGLDVGAVDLKIQSSKDNKGEVRKEPKFIVIETNSAPSFGDITLEKYKNEIGKILLNKNS